MKKAIKIKDSYSNLKQCDDTFRIQAIYKLDPPYIRILGDDSEEEINYVFVSGIYSDHSKIKSLINSLANTTANPFAPSFGMFSSFFSLHEVMVFAFDYDPITGSESCKDTITEIRETTSHVLALDSIGYRIVDE